jgi:DNA-binding NtrC family response regulator
VFTVLFADDSRNIREFCGRELEKEGYRVLLVSSGEAALETCLEEPPDIVVLDVRMPGMDGIETAGRIVRAGLGIPVIFYTAYKDRLATELSSWAAVECVEKAEALTELKAVISRTLASRAGAEPRSRPGERLHNDVDRRRNAP